MTTLKLPLLMDDCPAYWKKFARTFDSSGDLVRALKPWRGRPLNLYPNEIDMDGLTVEFETEQDLAWFILNWS